MTADEASTCFSLQTKYGDKRGKNGTSMDIWSPIVSNVCALTVYELRCGTSASFPSLMFILLPQRSGLPHFIRFFWWYVSVWPHSLGSHLSPKIWLSSCFQAWAYLFCVCPYHFPYALPHRHCHPAWSSHRHPQGGGGLPAGGLWSSCCSASPTRQGHCRSSSAESPGEGPGAGSPPRTSLGGMATREQSAASHWTEEPQGLFHIRKKGVFWGVLLDLNLLQGFILKHRSQPQVLRGQWMQGFFFVCFFLLLLLLFSCTSHSNGRALFQHL